MAKRGFQSRTTVGMGLAVIVAVIVACAAVVTTSRPRAKVHGELTQVRDASKVRIVVAAAAHLRPTPNLLDFNMNVVTFQDQFFDAHDNSVNARVAQYLSALPGALYRYPGGLQANHLDWKWAVGPDARRSAQGLVKWQPSTKVLFGPAEYVHFVTRVQGRPLMVLNLVGWSHNRHFRQLDIDRVAANQGEFAGYLRRLYAGHAWSHLYELGNELDRGDQQWGVKEYIRRAQAVAKAVKRSDPDAKFIVPVRGFEWVYRGKKAGEGVSRGIPYSRQLFAAIKGASGVSMHLYYDPPWRAARMYLVPSTIARAQRVLAAVESERGGRPVSLWVTEHARDWRRFEAPRLNSDLAAAVSTGDFLAALMQVPEAKGACWHELNGIQWQVFKPHGAAGKPGPRPIYWAFRVLQKAQFGFVLPTVNYSTDDSGYAGGYDTRAVAFRGEDKATLGLWAINRRRQSLTAGLEYAPYAGCSGRIRHYYIAGATGVNPDARNITVRVSLEGKGQLISFNRQGGASIVLPPSSVSSFIIQVAPGEACHP